MKAERGSSNFSRNINMSAKNLGKVFFSRMRVC